MKAISFSGCFKSFSVNFASLLPFLDKCLMRYLLTRIKAVSVPEKKAERMSNMARSVKSVPSGISSLNYGDSYVVRTVIF